MWFSLLILMYTNSNNQNCTLTSHSYIYIFFSLDFVLFNLRSTKVNKLWNLAHIDKKIKQHLYFFIGIQISITANIRHLKIWIQENRFPFYGVHNSIQKEKRRKGTYSSEINKWSKYDLKRKKNASYLPNKRMHSIKNCISFNVIHIK